MGGNKKNGGGKKNNFRSRGARGGEAKMNEGAAADEGLEETLPFLNFNVKKSTDYDLQKAKDKFETFLNKNCPHSGDFISTGAYFVVPPLPPFAGGQDPGGFRRAEHQQLIKIRTDRIQELLKERAKTWSTIWGQLDDGLKNEISNHADFNARKAADDPLWLWQQITLIYNQAGPRAGLTAEQQAATLRTQRETLGFEYHSLKQGPREDVDKFLKRFLAKESVLVALGGIELGDDITRTERFVSMLDPRRFATFIGNVENFVVSSATLATPQGAAARAKTWKTEKTVPDGHDGYRLVLATECGKGDSTDPYGASDEFRGKCYNCHQRGHRASDCPEKKEKGENKDKKPAPAAKKKQQENKKKVLKITKDESMSESEDGESSDSSVHERAAGGGGRKTVMFSAEVYSLGAGSLDPFVILDDTCAEESIFREARLLTNIRDAERHIHISGIVGTKSIRVNKIGRFEPLGRDVFFSERAAANVLSHFDLIDAADETTYTDAGRTITHFMPNGEILEFHASEDRKTFSMDGSMWRSDKKRSMVTTVKENEKQFTKREVQEAKRARELQDRAGVSASDLLRMLLHGTIKNCPVTAKHFRRAEQIYGPSVAAIKGKMTAKKPDAVDHEPLSIEKRTWNIVVLYIDIFFVAGVSFLMSVSSRYSYVMALHIASRAIANVKKAITKMILAYRTEGIAVKSVVSDEEGGVVALQDWIAEKFPGVNVDVAGTNQHVPQAEIKIKQIKNKSRATASSVPFMLTVLLVVYLVYHSVFMTNCVPQYGRGLTTSPREAFTGKIVDYNKHLKVGFGDCVEAYAEDLITNTLKPRSVTSIALCPTGNVRGSWYLLNLESGRVITRDNFKVLPMPQAVIEKINDKAKREGKAIDKKRLVWKAYKNQNEADDEDFDAANEEEADNVEQLIEDLQGGAEYEEAPDDEIGGVMPPYFNQQDEDPDASSVDGEEESVSDGVRDEDAGAEDHVPYQEPPPRYNLRPRAYQHNYVFEVHRVLGNPEVEPGNLTLRQGLALGQIGEDSAKSELSQLEDFNTWTAVHRKDVLKQKLRQVIRSKMFMRMKRDGRLKSRLVAGGHMQLRSMYTEEDTASPTVSTQSAFMVAAIAGAERREVRTIDVVGAYLHCPIEKEVYMELDPLLSKLLCQLKASYAKYVDPTTGKILVRLNKALYGLVESAKLFYKSLSETLKADGFTVNPYDVCVFNKTVNGTQITVCFHVDDLMCTSRSKEMLDALEELLLRTYKEIKVHYGNKHDYLGVDYTFHEDGTVEVSMERYVGEVLAAHPVKGTAATPAQEDLFTIREKSPPLLKKEAEEFHSATAKLLYVGKRARGDILTAVAFLTTRVKTPTEDDKMKLTRVLKYLQGTKSLVLTLSADSAHVLLYIDASFATHGDYKSHTGVTISLGGGAVYAASSKQKLNSKSSTEAELIGVSDGLTQGLWTRNFLEQQGLKIGELPVRLFQDNLSTKALMERGRSASARTRHVNVRFFFVKDRMDCGEVQVEYLPTDEMVADLLTKPVQGELFRKLRAKLLNLKE